jgi:hypothetical protein
MASTNNTFSDDMCTHDRSFGPRRAPSGNSNTAFSSVLGRRSVLVSNQAALLLPAPWNPKTTGQGFLPS